MEHPPNLMSRVARLITADMEAAGLSQRELSTKIGVPLVTLNRRLIGASPFKLTELADIASVLQTTPSRILERAEEVDAA